ncbi:MAG TPA: FmdB family zinc ribbon protein, partial [Chthonomonadales bacterium]|nr:FmdB family zinc ribbon protein [Chthonomonadales bacterium]
VYFSGIVLTNTTGIRTLQQGMESVLMPSYSYRCARCGTEAAVRRAMNAAHASPACPAGCAEPMDRVYTAPQVIAQPFRLRDENRLYRGLSEKERTAQMKADDSLYERGRHDCG